MRVLKKDNCGRYNIIETESILKFTTRMRPVFRVVIGMIALFPLLAPYELLIKPSWKFSGFEFSLPSLFFFGIGLLVSLGAIAISIFFLMLAIFGLDRTILFNKKTHILSLLEKHVVHKGRTTHLAFHDIETVKTTKADTDGPDYYKIAVFSKTHPVLDFGEFRTESHAEQYANAIRQLMKA